jgi:predicted CXXCH cytochrome family protein
MRTFLYLSMLSALGAGPVPAQQLDGADGATRPAKSAAIFDQIEDARERDAFREVWRTSEPVRQRDLASRFVRQFPRSVMLSDAYEIAARASFSVSDFPASLDWAGRSLRLLPENPSLLVMVADVASRQKRLELAGSSARDALRYLVNLAHPASIPVGEWPQIRDQLRGTAWLVLGRIAALRGQNGAAEEFLLTALSLNPEDAESLYTLGIVRIALHLYDSAAPCLAEVIRGNGPLADSARKTLRTIYDRAPHPGASGFEEYVSSLKWKSPEPAAAAVEEAAGDYAGSAACRKCHPQEFERWQATGMAKMLRPYRAEDVIGDFSGKQTVEGSARAITDKNRHFFEVRDRDTDRWVRFPVDFLIGSKWQQAYATRLRDGEVLVFPIQYSILKSQWLNYWKIVDGPGSLRTDISRFHEKPDGALYQSSCAPCHTSQLRNQNGPERPESANYQEGGVNCEMCHGPSLAHLASISKGKSAITAPVDFKRISAEQSVAICAQCHMQSAVHEAQADGAVNYTENRVPFYRTYPVYQLSDFSRKAFYGDGRFRATTFIVESFVRSRCFREGQATCSSCHDPHAANAGPANPKSLKFGEDADEMCLQCHEGKREHPELHTHHAAGTEASRCVSCHMPRIMEALLFPARSHQIDDIPNTEMTERFGAANSPNACLACHRNRDTLWLRSRMEALWPSH